MVCVDYGRTEKTGTFAFCNGSRTNETVGPPVSAAEIATLHSSNAALPTPKIVTGAF